MHLAEFLDFEAIKPALSAGTKRALLQQLANLAGSRLEVAPAAILQTVLEREKLGSTGLGQGVAIPHGKLEMIEYESTTVGATRKMNVYTPPGYSEDENGVRAPRARRDRLRARVSRFCFCASSACTAPAKARSEKLNIKGLTDFMVVLR